MDRERKKEYDRERYQKNRKQILLKQKKYQYDHKEQIAIQRKIYRQEHSEEMSIRQKKHYQKNKEHILPKQKKYYQEHKEEKIAYVKKYQQENREQICIQKKKYYQKHREERRTYDKKKRQEHPDYDSEQSKLYRQKHPEECKESIRKWNKNNPEKVRESKRRRRARKFNASGSHTAGQIEFLRNISEGFCPGYNKPSHFVGKNKLTVDHIIPLIKGGSDYIENIQMMCKPCNSKKGISQSSQPSHDRTPFNALHKGTLENKEVNYVG